MYDPIENIDYDADEDLDLSEYEIIEEEEELETCSCARGCFNCLDMSWRDFM